jgi:hypothetical protein
LARDARKVLADVRDEYASIEGADPEGLCVDEEATAALRGAQR